MYVITVKTVIVPSVEISSALSLAIQKSTLRYFIWRGPWLTLQESAACLCGTDSKFCQCLYTIARITTATVTLTKKYVCAQAMLFAFYSDILAAVTLGWILPVLSFYMLYMSYSNLHKYKAWLAINNPSVISWTRYLVRPLRYQKIKITLVFFNFWSRERSKIKFRN